jgi:hypothetical protein
MDANEELPMTRGSCLCGRVTFELAGAPVRMNICHCSMCRKVTGSAYGVFAHAEAARFSWRSGREHVQRYESSPGHWRVFCRTCGSNLPNPNGEWVCIPAGAFDDDPGARPELQIFAGSKAPWHPLADEPTSYPEFDPD